MNGGLMSISFSFEYFLSSKSVVIGEWLLGVGGFIWSFYTVLDHSENGDYDGGW